MDKNLIESYKLKMLEMYESKMKPTAATPSMDTMPSPAPALEPTPSEAPKIEGDTGSLIGIVTNLRGLYFVPNAKVTVFKGSIDDMQVIDTSLTDQNGKTKEFVLPTPAKELSMNFQNTLPVYSLYNLMVEADGYLTNIHLNIPVFPDTVSRQTSNLLLLETAGADKGPQIFDEAQSYNL